MVQPLIVSYTYVSSSPPDMGHSVSSPLPGANLALAFVTPITDANPNRPLELHRPLIATLAGRDRYPFANHPRSRPPLEFSPTR